MNETLMNETLMMNETLIDEELDDEELDEELDPWLLPHTHSLLVFSFMNAA
jgi:hypothetical protein